MRARPSARTTAVRGPSAAAYLPQPVFDLHPAAPADVVFLLDVASGPGMAPHAAFYRVSRKAADLLSSAASGQSSPASDWFTLGGVVAVALSSSFAAFAYSARSRG